MTTYLLYVVIYNCFVNELLVKRDINISQEPIQFWYPMPWKHKVPYHTYLIHESFLGSREILTREVPDRITQEARNFLDGKGQLYIEDEHTYFQLFGFEGTPLLLPKFVTNKIFVLEFCRHDLY